MAALQSQQMLCTKEGRQFRCQVDHCDRSFTSWQGWQYHFLNKHTNIRNPALDESVEESFPLVPSSEKSEPTSPDSVYGDTLSSSSKESSPERDFVLGKRSAISSWREEEERSPKNQRNSLSKRFCSVCDICGKKLSSSSNLKVHKNTLHFGQRWRCKICGRTCTSKESVLKTCKKTHEGEDIEFVKPEGTQEIASLASPSSGETHLGDELETLECIQSIVSLSKSTVNVKEVKNEEGSETDSEPEYSAESNESDHWCEEEIPDGPSGRKPMCHICGKGFASNSSLKVHKNILHYGKRWRCRICGRVCTKKQNVQATCRRHHPGEDIEVISVTEADYLEGMVMESSADELNTTEPVIEESSVPWEKNIKMMSPKA